MRAFLQRFRSLLNPRRREEQAGAFVPLAGSGHRRDSAGQPLSREIGSLLTLFGLVVILSVLVLFYTRMRIEVSLLDRKIRQARIARIEQDRKNAALRAELARKHGEDAVLTYWKLYGALPDYEKNRVLRIRLPD